MDDGFQVLGTNAQAPFKLRVHRGEGMALLGMNWKRGRPPKDFVGFAIEFKEPGSSRWLTIRNRLSFSEDRGQESSRDAPFQKFRWVHFPFNAQLPGHFTYRVTPVFMDVNDELRLGPAQEARLALRRDTYPKALNVTFTRGFVASQAFVDRFQARGKIKTLLPGKASEGLRFKPTHPDTTEALGWMGFEARHAILEVLDQAIASNTAEVFVVAYDLSEPEVVTRLEALGPRLKIIIDDSGDHGHASSGEGQAAQRLRVSAGANQVKRQDLGGLQHNKTIIVTGPRLHRVVCGSTNYTWRGFYVQNNNAVILDGRTAVDAFRKAFDQYWVSDRALDFGRSPAAEWVPLGISGVDAAVTFSPHSRDNKLLGSIAADIAGASSSVIYSLAFLYQTPGPIRDAVIKATNNDKVFVFGMSDHKVKGMEVQTPQGNRAPVAPAALGADAPPPFKPEETGGGGNRLHHKFVVLDFDKPTARVYLGSYNFSGAADTKNGENLLLIKDRRVAVAYMVEAIRILDHYQFRMVPQTRAARNTPRLLRKPPRAPGEEPWFARDYSDPTRIRDRQLFS